MKYFGDGLSEIHKEVSKLLRKKTTFDEGKVLLLALHALLHQSLISNNELNEVDHLLDDLKDEEYRIMPTKKDETIAWILWHITRIEDLTMNVLVNQEKQLYNDDLKKHINSPIDDTGNALNDDEIMQLSQKIEIEALLEYRNLVGRKTREIINHLTYEQLSRKIQMNDLNHILEKNGVTCDQDSIWLLDYWGKKDVLGILLMPPTRHLIMHLNDCCRIKKIIREGKIYLK